MMSDVQLLSSINLKDVEQRIKDIAIGYVKQCQSLLPDTTAYYNIPISITYIILAFYYEHEKFDIVGKRIDLSDDCKTITVGHKGAGWCNAYGRIEIDSLSDICCYWKIKVVKETNNMFIGLSTHRINTSSFQYNYSNLFYALFNAGGIRTATDMASAEIRSTDGRKEIATPYARKYREGDIVTMRLNLRMKQLSFDINDEEYGVAVEDIRCDKDTKYYLALSTLGLYHKMTLLDFGFY